MRTYPLDPRMAPLAELVFGAASLGGRVSARAGLAALHAASAQGVTGVDLARSYGYGAAEGLVGRALVGRRDRFVLITKAGILPAPPPHPLVLRLNDLARPLLDRAQGLRRRLARRLVRPAPPAPLDAGACLGSLETSLRELRTDRVDVFLAHRCPATRAEYEGFAAACEAARDAGKLILWGICGDLAPVSAVSAHAPAPVIQVPGDVLTREPSEVRGLATRLVMYYQPFGGGPGFARLMAAAPPLPLPERARWATEVALRGLLLDAELPTVAVCAMNQPAHVAANAEALTRPRLADDELRAIRARLSAAASRTPRPRLHPEPR